MYAENNNVNNSYNNNKYIIKTPEISTNKIIRSFYINKNNILYASLSQDDSILLYGVGVGLYRRIIHTYTNISKTTKCCDILYSTSLHFRRKKIITTSKLYNNIVYKLVLIIVMIYYIISTR